MNLVLVSFSSMFYPEYAKFSDLGSHLGASCLIDSRRGAFCLRTVFYGTSSGTPLDRLWPPLRHPWFDSLVFLKDLGANLQK